MRSRGCLATAQALSNQPRRVDIYPTETLDYMENTQFLPVSCRPKKQAPPTPSCSFESRPVRVPGTLGSTWLHASCCCSCSVTQSCLTLCNPMDCNTPGLPVHHHLPELAQTLVHRVHDAIQPSHPLSSPSPPAFNLSQHQGLVKSVSSSNQVAKVLEFQLQHQSSQ